MNDKDINNYIERLEKRIKDTEDYETTQVWLTNDVYALRNLIKGYKELEEKNKRWENFFGKYFKDIEQEFNGLLNHKFIDYIPKSKVKELAKKYEFALNDYDSSTADYKHSQNLGRYMACVELLKEGE